MTYGDRFIFLLTLDIGTFLSIVYDHTRYTWIHLLKHKSKAPMMLKNFATWVHTQFVVIVKAIQMNNVKELALIQFLAKKGIHHQFSCVETPEQNSISEKEASAPLDYCASFVLPI